jgi:hypothetical protein
MTDQSQDSLTATGKHRAWIGERLNERAGERSPTEPQRTAPRSWVGRPQPSTPTTGNSRHAAITKRLANFPSYKSWAEKAKSNWREDEKE